MIGSFFSPHVEGLTFQIHPDDEQALPGRLD
jgi:hypothetical protein